VKNQKKPFHKEYQEEWLGYRPQIKVLDCTIRDGGLMNDHEFNDDVVKAVYNACVEAGIDYMEFGYKADKKIFSPKEFGRWKFCDEDDIRRIVGDNKQNIKLSMMADVERTDYHNDILHNPKFRSRPLLKCIRDYIEPMREKLLWGFGIPYMITGQLNLHPRDAMKFMESGDNKDIVKFYDSVLEED